MELFFSPGQITSQSRPDEFGIKTDIGLAEARQRGREFNESLRGRLFQESNRAHHGQPAMYGRRASRPIVHQKGGGMNFLSETDGFPLAGINIQNEIQLFWRLNDYPGGQNRGPLAHEWRRIGLLQFVEYHRGNNHLPEQTGENVFSSAQNQIMQRRRIGNDNAHGREKIFPSVTWSTAKSATE